MRNIGLSLLAIALVGCGQPSEETSEPAAKAPPAAEATATGRPPADMSTSSRKLAEILANQPAEVKARYIDRHPQETLEFFGILPGMTVVEALPGGGWYSKILIPYLGPEGELVGADYALDMYDNFDFVTPEFIEDKKTWTTDWPEMAQEWYGEEGASISAFVFGSLPEAMHGTADAVLLIRAMHNLARFDANGGYLGQAIEDCYDVLKPGGIAGVVQHEARENMPDEWAGGQNGYLKRSFIVSQMEAAGFEFVEASDINANERDQPTTEDAVWRLPPSLQTSLNDEALRVEMLAIGESNRMTLKFRKPETD